MFIYFADAPKSAHEIVQAQRRDLFANLLLKRNVDALNLLYERPVSLLDLELTGCTSIAEYEGIIKLILSHKENSASKKKQESIKLDGGTVRALRLDLDLDGVENIEDAKRMLRETLALLDG